MDTPDLNVKFIQLDDPTGPYGNKSLGEPPPIPVAPALRNAVLHATGVAHGYHTHDASAAHRGVPGKRAYLKCAGDDRSELVNSKESHYV